MSDSIDRKVVLAQFDEQVAGFERVCAKMKESRLKIEVSMNLSDAEFTLVMQEVAEDISAEMARAGMSDG